MPRPAAVQVIDAFVDGLQALHLIVGEFPRDDHDKVNIAV